MSPLSNILPAEFLRVALGSFWEIVMSISHFIGKIMNRLTWKIVCRLINRFKITSCFFTLLSSCCLMVDHCVLQVMIQILKDMGITEYEPRVINQMLEFTYSEFTDMFLYVNSWICNGHEAVCLCCSDFPLVVSHCSTDPQVVVTYQLKSVCNKDKCS